MVVDPEMGAGRRRARSTPVPGRGYLLAPDEGVPGRDAEAKCSLASTGGSLALYRTVLDGDGPPPHRHTHEDEDETIVVFDGTVEVECGPDTFTASTGATVFMPRGLTHTFRSVGGPATMLFIVAPGHLDDFFRLKDEASDPSEIVRLIQDFL